jgi:anaerobic magnesium-protoporphyrin IX monomethyl ester cyclase
MLDITLVNPPQFTRYPQPPVGLALLAAILQKEGHNVSLLDANALNLRPEDIPSQINEADIVGITAMTPTIGAAMDIARYLREAKPHLTIVLGGAHATLLPGETLTSSPDIDIIVRGEGDETVIELMQAIGSGRSLERVEGISYRDKGKIHHTPARSSVVDMDSLPTPAYELLEWDRYHPHPPHGLAMPFAAMVTSRGCPYRCAYCSSLRQQVQGPEPGARR